MTLETPESKPMTRSEIEEFLLQCGWRPDKNGILQKQGTKRLFRVKFQDESLRIEVAIERSALPARPTSTEWIRIGGAFYNKVKLHDDGRMQIGTDFFKVD